MTNVFLKPAMIRNEAGEDVAAIVRDPETMVPLDAGGEWKALSPFWTRRKRDGDVIDATAVANVTALPLVSPITTPTK